MFQSGSSSLFVSASFNFTDTFDHSSNIVEQHVYIQQPSEKGKIYSFGDAFIARDAYIVDETDSFRAEFIRFYQ